MMANRKRTNGQYGRTNSKTRKAAPSWLRIPITAPPGRPLRVLLYARYSSDEQNARSIDDQFAYCSDFLESLDLSNVVVDRLSDEALSGELVSRPGIDQVHVGCLEGCWDLLVAEDGSRLFRHETAAGELIETAVDEGIRVVLINDFLDTAQEDEWEDRLHEALRHHARSNKYTARRIKRTHTALWEMGAAVGMLKPGYIRKATVPATDRDPAKGPFFDEIDPKWAPVVGRAYEWIAADDLPRVVAERLTTIGLPKVANSKYSEWNEKNVIALIRRTVYRGFESFRDTVSQKKHRTGKRTQVPNDPDEVLTREMPHLQIVSNRLWYQANDAIDARIEEADRSSGPDHPLWGIPRNSRTPLSRILVCGVCGDRTHDIGRNGYRCRNTTKRARHSACCWNRASARAEIAHRAIRDALLDILEPLKNEEAQQAIVDTISRLLAGDDQSTTDRGQRRLYLLQKKQRLEESLDNLLDVAERGSKSMQRLAERIDRQEEELARVLAELEDIDVELGVRLSNKDLSEQIESYEERLQRFDRAIQCDLQQLVGTIEAVPHQQFGCNKVVLRGRFRFNPYKLLPARVRLGLERLHGDRLLERLPDCLQQVAISVDLFEPSTGPKHWRQALDCRDQSLGLTAIGKQLGITKRQANLAVQYGQTLREAGLTDPFIELTEPPAAASRWRPGGRDCGSQSDP